MKQYIDKATIVEEIEKIKHKLLDNIICESDKEWAIRTAHQLNRIIWFINTLDVKEVDLDNEIEKWICDAAITHEDCSITDIISTAKHFFELGIQQSNHNKNEEKS